MKSDHAIIVFFLDPQVARSFERPGGLRASDRLVKCWPAQWMIGQPSELPVRRSQPTF